MGFQIITSGTFSNDGTTGISGGVTTASFTSKKGHAYILCYSCDDDTNLDSPQVWTGSPIASSDSRGPSLQTTATGKWMICDMAIAIGTGSTGTTNFAMTGMMPNTDAYYWVLESYVPVVGVALTDFEEASGNGNGTAISANFSGSLGGPAAFMCLYDTQTTAGTPASGWTELVDDLTYHGIARHCIYVARRRTSEATMTTPASDRWSLIGEEFREASGGFGHIPIF